MLCELRGPGPCKFLDLRPIDNLDHTLALSNRILQGVVVERESDVGDDNDHRPRSKHPQRLTEASRPGRIIETKTLQKQRQKQYS